MDRLLTFKTVAAHTGTSEAFWRRLARQRRLPIVRLGRACRIKEGDLDAFLAQHCREARETVADCKAQRGHVGPEPVTPARP